MERDAAADAVETDAGWEVLFLPVVGGRLRQPLARRESRRFWSARATLEITGRSVNYGRRSGAPGNQIFLIGANTPDTSSGRCRRSAVRTH